MPSQRIPLIGSPNQRGVDVRNTLVTSDKDQRFVNFMPHVVRNQVTGRSTLYLEKRPGFDAGTTISGTDGCSAIYAGRQAQNTIVSCFGQTVFTNLASSGTTISTSGLEYDGVTSTLINETEYFLFNEISGVTTGNAWYSTGGTTLNFTGTTTNGSPVVTGMSSVANRLAGQLVTSASGIPADTRILSVDSGTQITLTQNATASGSRTLTIEGLAYIMDTDFPDYTIGGFAPMDGYVFIMTSQGRIYNSALNSVTDWSANNYISSGLSPDYGRGCYRHRNLIVAFGVFSTEFFRNAGNATGSPLSRVAEAALNVGTCSSVADDGKTLYWVGQTTDGVAGVMRMNGTQPERVSTAEVDAYLAYYGDTLATVRFYCRALKLGGLSIVTVSAGSNPALVWAYFVDLNIWMEWSFPTALQGLGYITWDGFNKVIYVGGTGKRYALSYTTPIFQENGSSYTAEVQTSRVDFGTASRKFISRIRLICDKQASGTATLEYSDDDYATWTTLGTFDLTSMRPEIHRCGSHVGGRAYRLTHSANTAFRAEALEIEYEVGT